MRRNKSKPLFAGGKTAHVDVFSFFWQDRAASVMFRAPRLKAGESCANAFFQIRPFARKVRCHA